MELWENLRKKMDGRFSIAAPAGRPGLAARGPADWKSGRSHARHGSKKPPIPAENGDKSSQEW
jgi:hypothetical protein